MGDSACMKVTQATLPLRVREPAMRSGSCPANPTAYSSNSFCFSSGFGVSGVCGVCTRQGRTPTIG
eukprot:5484063-Amphidinium_carterae.2